MGDITIKELDAKIDELVRLKEIYKDAKVRSTERYGDLAILQEEVGGIIEELGKTKHSGVNYSFSFCETFKFKVPKDLESKAKLMKYFEDRGILLEMVSFNSASLNAYAKAEQEASEEDDFQIPGLERSSPVRTYQLRKI